MQFVKAMLFWATAFAITFIFVGCRDTNEPVEIFDIGAENWRVFDFHDDSFPDEISFVAEMATCPNGVTTVMGILMNMSSPSQSYVLNVGAPFSVVKYVSNEWRFVPFEEDRAFFGYSMYIYPSGARFYSFSTDELYHGVLTAGTYRIITYAAIGPPAVMGMVRGIDVAWRGHVWAEFVVDAAIPISSLAYAETQGTVSEEVFSIKWLDLAMDYVNIAIGDVEANRIQLSVTTEDGISKHGMINEQGEIIIPFICDTLRMFSNCYAFVRLNERYLLVDGRTGAEVFDFSAISQIENFAYISDISMTGDNFVLRVMQDNEYFARSVVGMISQQGEILMPFIYDHISAFSEGLAIAERGNEIFFIDYTGTKVIDASHYDFVQSFRNGFAMVSLNGQWGLIDTFGNEILPTEFNSSMVRWAVDSNNINAFDELVSSGALSQFDSIGAINNGLARVRYNSQYGFIDTTGAIVIPVIYAGASDFANGFASVSEYADGRFYHSLIDTAGHTIFEPREYQIFVCESGMFIGHYNPFFGTAHSPRHMQTRNALLDQQGNYLTGFYYERISPFNNGFAIVTMHSLSPRREVGIINSQGTEVVPLIFSDIRFVSGNTYVVRAANDNQIGLLTLSTSVQSQQIRIRVNGEFVYIPHYDQHPVIIDGRVLVPLRAVMEAMGLYVRWYEAEQAIYVGDDSVAAMLRIGSPYLSIDDGPVFYLDVQPQIINNRTMVPVRAIAEAFHMRVEWYPNERIVDINRVEPLVFVHSQPMPIVPIADWPAHLPRYIAGSIEIFDDGFFETYIHEAYFPLQFRAIWYYMCADIAALPRGENQGRRLAGWERHNDMNRMQLMDFVYWADISREDFDAHIERVRAMYISLGIDYNNEWEELPNADIIFSFNQEIARYFFRRE